MEKPLVIHDCMMITDHGMVPDEDYYQQYASFLEEHRRFHEEKGQKMCDEFRPATKEEVEVGHGFLDSENL